MFDDQSLMSAALLDALPKDSTPPNLCVGKTTHVDAVGAKDSPEGRDVAVALTEHLLATAGCTIVHGAAPAEADARIVVLAWGWEAEGYETTTTTSFGIELNKELHRRARVRARASVELQVFGGGHQDFVRKEGTSQWQIIAEGAFWPIAALPAIGDPVPYAGKAPQQSQ
ncbi:MAG TPA: hypothetical protein VGO62_08950 [Myxococcota bacterium]